jgi:hypothetical protein
VRDAWTSLLHDRHGLPATEHLQFHNDDMRCPDHLRTVRSALLHGQRQLHARPYLHLGHLRLTAI